LARAGREVTYEIHDVSKRGPRGWAEARLFKSENLRGVVFISNELKKVYIKKHGGHLAHKRVVVAPDGADEQPNFSEKAVLNGNFGFNACYIGSLHRGRGIELILEVAGRMPDVGFHLFGGTEGQVFRLRKRSSANVHFYGHVTPAETYKARNVADVLLMPYQRTVMIANDSSETSQWMSPIKLFEYMSARKPIVSSSLRVLQEVLEDNHNCLLCEPDNMEQWIEAVTRLRSDKKLCKSISSNAFEDFINKYTWDKRIKRILDADKVVKNG